jgi:SAM-dependent methyltransferase
VSPYLFEHDWEQERRRLDLLEQVYDLATQAFLERLPLPAGGQCLEVGAGAGSIARWLCDRVGPDGRVVATDLDTGFLETLTEKNLEVRRHDIGTDDLEEGVFDLIHSRLVLEHIPGRDRALPRLVAALRPGGWLLLEDFDWLKPSAAPNCVGAGRLERVHDAARALLADAGYREDYGVALPGEMRSAGLVDIGAEGRTVMGVPGSPATAWWQLTMAKFCLGLLERGRLTESEVEEFLALFDDEGFVFRLPTLVTVWGRCPVPEKGWPE